MAQIQQARVAAPDQARLGGLDERYVVYGEIASGGMASVQYGRLLGPHGFTRPVAVKRLHPHFAKKAEFLSMFIDEARLSARLVHANIIHTLDVIQTPGELALVMEYVHGESLWTLLRLAREQGHAVPIAVACSLVASTLHGLHAAHEACGDTGEPLEIVHRDVSPPNILVGSDGIPRLLDFGIARALGRVHSTPCGEIKGKLGYVAPEQLHGTYVDRRTDVYGASAVLWEALTGAPLFDGPSESAIVHRVLHDTIQAASAHRKEVPSALDALVLKGLARDMVERFSTAQELALALERSTRLASQSEIATWLQEVAGAQLAARSRQLSELQAAKSDRAGSAQTRRLQGSAGAAEDPLLRELRPRRVRSWAVGSMVTVLILAAAWAATAAPHQHLWPAIQAHNEAASPPLSTAARVEPRGHFAADEPVASEPPAPPSAAPAPREAIKRLPRRAAAASAPPSAAAAENHGQPDPCVPFYNIDERGIRRPKPECL